MACCGESNQSPPQRAAQPGPSPSTILNRRTRKWIHLHQALVDAVPDGGWRFQTSINGVPLEIVGSSPADVMAKTRQYYSVNSVPFNELEFWIDANIQWVERSNIRHHLVSVADLLATKNQSFPNPTPKTPATHPPSEWGSVAWRWLGLILAKDRYDAAEFVTAMRIVTDMLNPSTNQRLGCAECHTEAAGMLNELVHNPPRDITAARIWLANKHNSVNARLGKPELGISEAATANFWD
jgi:hypothetical protein